MILYTLILAVSLPSCGSGDHRKEERRAGVGPELSGQVGSLDNMLYENSGLIRYDGKLWTINDSGGDAVLFAVDEATGKALQAVRISNARNEDWESLAQDENHIYICDVGNNYGRREVLRIYRIAKDSIPGSGNAELSAEIISFTYAGRGENNPLKRSPYDCEAVFALGDSLYLFSKDWEGYSTTLYTCSTGPGEYKLEPRISYPVDGLVTGADISPDSSFVVLCGYKDFIPLVWVIRDFNTADYSHGRIFRFNYPSLTNLQTEGVAVISPERVYISCEKTEYPAALYRMDLRPYLE
jgi:hypothetical protein